MELWKNKKPTIDMPWDGKGTVGQYILGSYYGGKRMHTTFKKVQKKYRELFKSESEMLSWIQEQPIPKA